MAKAIDTLSIRLEFKDAGTQQIVDKIKGSFKGLQQVVSGNTQPAIRKLRSEINTLASAGNKSISTIEGQVTALRALRREADINSKEFKELTADIGKYEKQLNKAQGRRGGGSSGGRALAATQIGGAIVSGGIFGGPEGAIGGAIGSIGGVPGAFAGAAIGAQIGGIRKSLGGVAETVAEINAMKIALAGVSTGAEDYRKSIDSVMSISKEFLFPVDKAIGEFTRLKAAVVGAGFGTKETTDAFKGFAAAILATGGNSEKLSGALLAASQVFSKGKVQAEELRGQIGERLPGAFTTFAQSIGVGSKELDEMLRKGEVSTENFVEFTRTLFARYEKTAETLGSSPEKAGQRLQLALSLATIEYGGFFQKVGAGFQDYITGLVTFATDNKETFKKVAANVVVFAQDVKTVIKGLVTQIKQAFGGMFVFLGQALKVFIEQIVVPFFNAIKAGIEGIAKQVNLGQAERKLGGAFGRAGAIRAEELEAYRKEKDIVKPGRLGTSVADNDEIERRAQKRILQEAGMAPKSRDDMFADAMKGLDKAFAVFDPSSGFGTSLGTSSGTGTGETEGTASSTGTDKTQARIGHADEIVRKLRDQLKIQEAQTKVGQFIAKQGKERSDLEAKFQALLKDGANEKISQAKIDADGLLLDKQALELQARAKKLMDEATKPLEDMNVKLREKISFDKEYKRLISEGINPELANQLIKINELFEAGDKKLEQQLLDLENEKLKIDLGEAQLKNINDQIDAIKSRREAEKGKKAKAEGSAGEAYADPSFMDTLRDKMRALYDEATNLNEQIANVGVKAVGDFADAFVELAMTGKSSFKELTVSILQDLAKIIMRAAVLQAFKSLVPGLFAADGAVTKDATPVKMAANGLAVARNGIVPYAKGGLVTKPTLFQYKQGGVGNYGLMGEAGTEAIMPLRRGSNGKLGVESSGGGASNVVINVDASGSNVQGDQPNAKALGAAIGAAVQAELVKQKRPGGLLS